MSRDYTTFYRSFYESIESLENKEDKADAYKYMFEYLLDLKNPDSKGIAKSIFIASKPGLDSILKQYKNGLKPKISQQQAKPKPTTSHYEEKYKPITSQTEANHKPIRDKRNDIRDLDRSITMDLKQNSDGLIFEGVAKSKYQKAKEMLNKDYDEISRSSSFEIFKENKLITHGNLIGYQSSGMDPAVIKANLDSGAEQLKDEGLLPLKPFFKCMATGTYWNYERKKVPLKKESVNHVVNGYKYVESLTEQQLESFNKGRYNLSRENMRKELVYEIVDIFIKNEGVME